MPIEHIITLTDDQLHWLRVALENSKDHAQRLADEGVEDIEDGLLLMEKYNELQEIIGTTDPIGLTDE